MVKSYDFGRPTKYYDLKLKDFLGVDFSSYPSEVSPKRTPEAVNIFSSRNGIIEKRTGFKKELEISHSALVGVGEDATIHGFWQFSLEQESLISVGGGAYNTESFGNLIQFCQLGRFLYYRYRENPEAVVSWGSWQHVLYEGTSGTSLDNVVQTEIDRAEPELNLSSLSVTTVQTVVDGGSIDLKRYRVFFFGAGVDGVISFEREKSTSPLELEAQDTWRQAYVPTIRIGCDATGGGEYYEDISVLTPKRKAGYTSFYSSFKLPETNVDTTTGVWFHGTTTLVIGAKTIGYVDVTYRHADGSWRILNEGTDYTVDRETGQVTVTATVSTSSVTGEDDMVVIYSVGVAKYIKPVTWNTSKKKIASWFSESNVFGNFGLSGKTNYLFCAIKNMDRYINLDTFYSSDLAYTIVGSDQADILGYSNVENNMIVHKERFRSEGTMYIRSANLDSESEVIFPIRSGASNIGAVSKETFTMFKDEPMFLTKDGVYAVVTNNITNVQALQNRSYYIDKKLASEPNLERSRAISHDGYWYLFLENGHVYVADSRRKSYAQDAKTESFQYDWYYWEGITAKNAFVMDDKLYFTNGNKVYVFRNQEDDDAYNDVNALNVLVPVVAYWTTPILYMGDITYKKSLKNLWARLATYGRSGVQIYYRLKGEEKMVKQTNIDLFDFGDIDFTRFTFNTDESPHVVVTNRMERQFISIQFMFKNTNAEPFGLLEIIARYKINSEYKGG